MLNNMQNMQNVNMQNNMQINMQNMQTICRFGAGCLVLTIICRICQIICSICRICYGDFQYAQYAFPTGTVLMQRLIWILATYDVVGLHQQSGECILCILKIKSAYSAY